MNRQAGSILGETTEQRAQNRYNGVNQPGRSRCRGTEEIRERAVQRFIGCGRGKGGSSMAKLMESENEESLDVSWVGGVSLQAAARKHRIVVDQPEDDGGKDQGMTPVELFVASLGTCIGYYAVRFCQRHDISTQGLKVQMKWSYAEQPHRIGRMSAEVHLPAKLSADLRERLQKVVEGCTVHHSITISPEISVEISGPP